MHLPDGCRRLWRAVGKQTSRLSMLIYGPVVCIVWVTPEPLTAQRRDTDTANLSQNMRPDRWAAPCVTCRPRVGDICQCHQHLRWRDKGYFAFQKKGSGIYIWQIGDSTHADFKVVVKFERVNRVLFSIARCCLNIKKESETKRMYHVFPLMTMKKKKL